MKQWYVFLWMTAVLFGCGETPETGKKSSGEGMRNWSPRYAKGFSSEHTASGITYLTISSPWPGASRKYRYALVPKNQLSGFKAPADSLDAVIGIPAKRIILTSTTHIPSLEKLNSEELLIGFPGIDYISSPRTRKRIQAGKIQELGANEQLNTERVLALQPDLVVGFGVSGAPRSYQALRESDIPVIFNGDWMEEDPLGKAEWIVFFGLLLGKQAKAEEAFREVEKAYMQARKLAAESRQTPTVMSGALYRDIWYLPGGSSWAARFIKDANAHYLWEGNPERGSLSLSLESVLDKATSAEFWIAPSQYTSYEEMALANPHYKQFKAFQQENVYSYANSMGASKGMLYYELGPSRPDLVLQDLIYWFHPGLLEDYEPVFFKPLKK